jgi:two-component system sensor histidine kinase MtrB
VPLEHTSLLERLMGDAGDGRVRGEITITRADGVRRVVDVTGQPRREDGMVVGYQGVVRDITAAHDLEMAKNEFLALITHDLRNPLTTILGLGATLETYASELPPDRIQRMGVSIRSQAERISRLADDLYDVSRLETSSLVLNPRTVDLATSVEIALAAAGTHSDLSEVTVAVPAGLQVHADPRRLEQVVANLVDNALTHGAAPVEIAGRSSSAGTGVELVVRDHGRGVPDALVPTLFSRLRTFGRPDRDRGRGTGLGLTLVRGLVEAMGGQVHYERAEGGGAAFRLTIPSPRATGRA